MARDYDERIFKCWQEGRKCNAKNPRGYNPLFTDGTTIFSYDHSHPIIHRGRDGYLYVLAPHLDHEKPSGRQSGDDPHYYSVTTRQKVRDLVPRAAVASENPILRREEVPDDDIDWHAAWKRRWRAQARAGGYHRFPENVVCVKSFRGLERVVSGFKLEKAQAFSCPGWAGPNPDWLAKNPVPRRQVSLLGDGEPPRSRFACRRAPSPRRRAR